MTAPKLHQLTHPDGGKVSADREQVENYLTQGWTDEDLVTPPKTKTD